jgi:hypothetical protein
LSHGRDPQTVVVWLIIRSLGSQRLSEFYTPKKLSFENGGEWATQQDTVLKKMREN